MPSAPSRRRLLFALAVVILLGGSAVSSLTGSAGRPPAGATERSRAEAPAPPIVRSARLSAARSVALRFVGAYLAYEAGRLGVADREALAGTATARLAGQLASAPVRLAPGERPPAPRLRRLLGARVDLFEAEPALSVAALIGGGGETHVLRLSLVRRGVGWRVAGVGR